MFVTGDLCALVPSAEVEALEARLQRELGPGDVTIRRPEEGHYTLHDGRLHETVVDSGRGALLGGVLGAVVGALVAAFVAGAGGAELALITFAGVAFGGLVGGVVGLQRHEPMDDDPCCDAEVAEGDDLVLVTVHAEHARAWVYRLVEKTPGARILQHADRLPEPAGGRAEPRR